MLIILGHEIRLTRGDTAYLSVSLTNRDGTPYIIQPDDTLTLSVKKGIGAVGYALQKRAVGTEKIKLLPEDTAHLPFGQYKYDIQLAKSNGDIFTVISVSNFILLEEVSL